MRDKKHQMNYKITNGLEIDNFLSAGTFIFALL